MKSLHRGVSKTFVIIFQHTYKKLLKSFETYFKSRLGLFHAFAGLLLKWSILFSTGCDCLTTIFSFFYYYLVISQRWKRHNLYITCFMKTLQGRVTVLPMVATTKLLFCNMFSNLQQWWWWRGWRKATEGGMSDGWTVFLQQAFRSNEKAGLCGEMIHFPIVLSIFHCSKQTRSWSRCKFCKVWYINYIK